MTVAVCLLACAACLYCGWLVGALSQQERVDRAYQLGVRDGHQAWAIRTGKKDRTS